MKWLVIALVVALSLVACDVRRDASGPPFTLLTAPASVGIGSGKGCFTFGVAGALTVGPFGPTIDDVPVLWPAGFTGQRRGNEIAVFDPRGTLVATTGQSYNFDGGYVGDASLPGLALPTESAFFACDRVTPI